MRQPDSSDVQMAHFILNFLKKNKQAKKGNPDKEWSWTKKSFS